MRYRYRYTGIGIYPVYTRYIPTPKIKGVVYTRRSHIPVKCITENRPGTGPVQACTGPTGALRQAQRAVQCSTIPNTHGAPCACAAQLSTVSEAHP